MRRVALTGGIATGKSYVRAGFQALGIPTIDADALARDTVAAGTPGLDAVVRRFGTGVLTPAGSLDRKALGEIVFADAGARRDLEAIVHPRVRQAIDAWFASLEATNQPIGIADIPLLFETGREREFDAVIVTACPPDVQLERIMARDGLDVAAATLRMRAQLPLAEKVRRAHYVITTDGSFDDTDRQVQVVRDALAAGIAGA